MKLPYHSELVRLQKHIETTVFDYPKCCIYSARVVKKALGLKEIRGIFVPEYYEHSWNYDPENKVFIDLTIGQFGKKYNKMMILPENNDLLRPSAFSTFINRFLSDELVERMTFPYDNKKIGKSIDETVRLFQTISI